MVRRIFGRRMIMGGLVAACVLATAPAASAGPLASALGSCPSEQLERPFLRWLDPLSYTLVPGGSFEAGTTGWTLNGAKVVSGNESYYAGGAQHSRSLSIPAGGSATTPPICVSVDRPVARLFTKSTPSLLSTLRVDVLYEDARGNVLSLPVGVATAGTKWTPTLPMPVLVNLLSVLADGRAVVAFRFTPQGSASWWIDDVYIDPKRR